MGLTEIRLGPHNVVCGIKGCKSSASIGEDNPDGREDREMAAKMFRGKGWIGDKNHMICPKCAKAGKK